MSEALKDIQSRVIGLFRPRFYPAGEYIPVITNNDGVLTCIEVGTLLGMSTLTIGQETGTYIPFPKRWQNIENGDVKLSDMMKDPVEFDKWYKANAH